jgi:hypothetical protein
MAEPAERAAEIGLVLARHSSGLIRFQGQTVGDGGTQS